jgi:hypothetical protein
MRIEVIAPAGFFRFDADEALTEGAACGVVVFYQYSVISYMRYRIALTGGDTSAGGLSVRTTFTLLIRMGSLTFMYTDKVS